MAESNNQTAISVKDLHMSYGPNEAVRGISFEVSAGEVFGVEPAPVGLDLPSLHLRATG